MPENFVVDLSSLDHMGKEIQYHNCALDSILRLYVREVYPRTIERLTKRQLLGSPASLFSVMSISVRKSPILGLGSSHVQLRSMS